MGRARWVLALLVLTGVAGATRVALWRPFTVPEAAPADGLARATGAIHVHTTASDGSGTVLEVVDAARAAGLDFLIVTDHRSFAATPQEGYAGRTLLMVGTEVSTRSGHVLVIGAKEPPFPFTDDALEVIEDVKDFGGAAIVAHPDGPREEFRWTRWDLPGPWGVELFNGDTQWRSAGWFATARAMASLPFNSAYALLSILSRPDNTFAQWDQRLSRRDTAIIAGTDAHGFPSYESLFKLVRNHVLLERPLSGDAAADAAAIVSSVARGRNYVALDALAPAGGFSFVAEQGSARWSMGEEVPASPAPALHAGGALPAGAQLSLFRDGQLMQESAGRVDLDRAEPGVYRVEVRLPGWQIPWIVSNPIYVFSPEDAERRRLQAELPVQVPPPPAIRIIDDFEGATAFEAAADGSTTIARDIVAAGAGADGGTAARLAFTLGTPSAANPSPFAALTSVQRRDLSGSRGLVFSVKADREARMWVQVRDSNPQSADGTEWWYLSVKATTAWRRVAVPFDRFRTRDAHSDGRLDRDATTGVFFIVDTGAAYPGSTNTIWIDAVGLY